MWAPGGTPLGGEWHVDDQEIADTAAMVKRLLGAEGVQESYLSVLEALDAVDVPDEMRPNMTFREMAAYLAAMTISTARGDW